MVDKIILELPADTVGGDILVSTETRERAEAAAAQAEATASGMIVDGTVTGDDLVLTKTDGGTVVAGKVRGGKGEPGLPGVNAVANDEATATYIRARDTETRAAFGEAFNDSAIRASFSEVQERATVVTGQSLLGVVGGRLYGSSSATQITVLDGDSWVDVVSLPAGLAPRRLYPLANGEVLVNRDRSLWLSSGWAVDPSGATFTEVLAVPDPTNTRFHQGWGVSVEGNHVLATEYGTHGISRYGWFSSDGGATFAVVFDLHDYPGGSQSGAGGGHMHGAGINPYDGTMFLILADASAADIRWAELSNPTVWTPLPDLQVAGSGNKINPTTIEATSWGMVLGSDGDPNGVWHINHSPTRDYRVTFPLVRHYGLASTQIVGQHIFVDDRDVAWNLFSTTNPDHHPGFIAAGGSAASQSVVWEDYGLQMDSPFTVFPFDGYLYVGMAGQKYLRLPRPEHGAPSPVVSDSGYVLGGKASYSQSAVAVGVTADAPSTGATAVGALSEAKDTGATAIGRQARAETAGSIAIGGSTGPETTITVSGGAVNAIAIGSGARSTGGIAIGATAKGGGATSVVIGPAADGGETSSGGTIVGHTAKADGSNAVAIGRNAVAGGSSVAIGNASEAPSSGVAVGYLAKASVNQGVAIGREAVASHAGAIAIGYQAVTTANNQLNVGKRHIEIDSITDTAAPATGAARLFTRVIGGKTQICARFPTGSVVIVSQEA